MADTEKTGKIKLFIFIALILVAMIAAWQLNAAQHLKSALAWIEGLGVIGPVVYILLYAFATVAFLPGLILTIGGGVVFGFAAIPYVAIGATLGAALAFLIGRYLARDAIQSKVEESKNFAAIDQAVGEQGWKIVGLARLSPVFPFNLLNYALGLTQVRFWHYFFATAVGMLPGIALYVYIGTLVGNLAQVGAENRSTTLGEWLFLGFGLLVTVAIVLYVTKVARQALQQQTETELDT